VRYSVQDYIRRIDLTGLNKSSGSERESLCKGAGHADEEVQARADRDVADHAASCKEADITVQTFYRWRKEFCGLKLDQAKRLKELEKENSKLKRLVAELSLEKQVLKDIAEGDF
jgi:hypothetical protein